MLIFANKKDKKMQIVSEMAYDEAKQYVKEKFKAMKHGQIQEFVDTYPHIKYPSIISFINNKLRYNGQKIIADCLEAFGFEDVEIEKKIIFHFKSRKNI